MDHFLLLLLQNPNLISELDGNMGDTSPLPLPHHLLNHCREDYQNLMLNSIETVMPDPLGMKLMLNLNQ